MVRAVISSQLNSFRVDRGCIDDWHTNCHRKAHKEHGNENQDEN